MRTSRQDIIHFIGKLTAAKVINILLITASFWWSRLWRKPVIWGKPVSLAVEPTTACNLRCPECPSGLRSFTRPTGQIDSQLFTRIIDEQAPTLSYLLLYFQGEPFLHKDFLSLVSYAHQKGIYTATSTNAHYFDDETAKATVLSGLDRLIISIDGTTQEVYEQYRVGGRLDKVLDGARKLVYWRQQLNQSKPYLIFQFLVVRPNEHQTDAVRKLAREIGIDKVAFKTAQLYDFEEGHELMPANPAYARYRLTPAGKYELKNKLYNHCWKMWHNPVITWDGTVVPCCFDKDAHHPMGNVSENGFAAIWHGAAYHDFRKRLLTGRQQIDICKNCTEGTRVWV